MCCGGGSSRNPNERAAMCQVCIRSERLWDDDGHEVWGCTVSGESLGEHIPLHTRDCPLNRYPDDDGIVLWFWIRWHGVPYPIRLWIRLTHSKHPHPRSFAGCGCVVSLKRAWGSVLALWRLVAILRV